MPPTICGKKGNPDIFTQENYFKFLILNRTVYSYLDKINIFLSAFLCGKIDKTQGKFVAKIPPVKSQQPNVCL